ncbi:MAG TPA: glycosyltransferase [Gemmataceae bacterium]|jgi:glycosyltransferase involved in cell wall biosynthesis|nr:glycosyltransferase [Gemmataceae bacterium]
MHIAILDEELPYPLTSGKRIRTFNLLQRLAGRHRLTYICHRNADVEESRIAARHFAQLGIETVVVDRSVPPKSGPKFYGRLAANLFSPLPFSVATHSSAELRNAVRTFGGKNDVDLWHCEWTPYAEMMRGLDIGPWLVMAHNVESLIWQRYTETEGNPVKRFYIRRQWQKFEQFERWAYSAARRTIAVSPDDARLIRERFGAWQVDVVDNGVDTNYFRPLHLPREPKTLLFLGSLDWRPNLDGVRMMLENIFPTVQSFEPDAKLLLVGRNPPDWLRQQVLNRPGIELHGSVPDVRPFIARAGVMAVPLRIGGGSRLKILESLASSLPVVSTRVGAEGLELEAEKHLDIVDGIEPMAESLIAAIRNPERIQQQAEAGRRKVLERYDWGMLAERLEQVWLDCARRDATAHAA